MSDSGQTASDMASAPPVPAPWWGQTSDDQPQEASGQQAGATETSFWDRVEDATRGQKGRSPFQSWESGRRPPAAGATEPETAEDAIAGDGASPEPSDEPPALVTFAPSRHREEEAGIAASAEGQDGEELQPSRITERRGGALIAELDGIARDLAEARPSASAVDDKIGRLHAAIENARNRPREIDAMLALSEQLDTLVDLVAMNARMAAAIDSAVRALRGDEGASSRIRERGGCR